MAKSFLVSPGRAYLVIAEEGTKIVRANGTLIDTVPEGANSVSITVDSHEIIVMDNAAKIQQLYNGNSGSSGIMTTAEGEDAGSWKIEIVSSLPEQGTAGIIYMLRTNRTGTDRYDDYIWIPEDNAYELLGRRPESTPIDLSNVAKTDVANVFNKSQQINGTLTATTINVANLNCDQNADLSNAAVRYLEYGSAAGSEMIANRLTVTASLYVDSNAAVRLPGLDWRNNIYGAGRMIQATYDFHIDTLYVHQTARVSKMLTLGNGNITLDGATDTISVGGTTEGVTLDTTGVTVQAEDAYLTVTGDSIVMTARPNRTVFSLAPTDDGKYLLNASDGATLGGSVSVPGTLTVKDLNVTGTVTGIPTGGDTPVIDFSNGVTIMSVLTAEDIVADDVTATTLAASTSVSVDGVTVAYRNRTEGTIRIAGDIVTATNITATTLQPTYIQGATFTAPLTIGPDNSIVVWKTGGTLANITNGDLTGFGAAEFDSATIGGTLKAERVSAVNVLCQTAVSERVSVTDRLVVKDLDITGAITGLPESGGSIEIPDPLNVTNLSADAAVLGVVTVSDTLMLLPDAATEEQPDVSSGCIELGWDASQLYPRARFAVGRFTVETNHKDGPSSPILAILNETASVNIDGEATSIQKFKAAIAPAYEQNTVHVNAWQSGMLELTGDNAWRHGGTSQFALTARVDTLRVYPSYAAVVDKGVVPPVLSIDVGTDATSSMVELNGTLAHYAGGSSQYTSYYMDSEAAYYYGGNSSGDGINNPVLYINPNTRVMSDVRALYSWHTSDTQSALLTEIPGLYARNMLCATALTAGTAGIYPALCQFGVNAHGAFIQKPLRALDSTSDITGLYYKPVTNTILPNLWQELVTSEGRPLSSVSEYTLDDDIFGLLVNTDQHPSTMPGFPNTGNDDNSAWETSIQYNMCVSSIEFGFSTGANGLTMTWPSQVIWPDEPNRTPPTQFQPNMCYRFVARMEPIPDPNSEMFNTGVHVSYKWVILVSQTYSYPNPWATT